MANGYIRIDPAECKKGSFEVGGNTVYTNILKTPFIIPGYNTGEQTFTKTILLDTGDFFDISGDSIIISYPVFITVYDNDTHVFNCDSESLASYNIQIGKTPSGEWAITFILK